KMVEILEYNFTTDFVLLMKDIISYSINNRDRKYPLFQYHTTIDASVPQFIKLKISKRDPQNVHAEC
ncbi:hypothetical protein RCT75_12020, partial [Escherichia marmotae]|nr:hypothetical protein [Escherichia marmotae]